MNFNFFGGNLQLWKLHTLSDYLLFGFVIAAGFLFFALWNRRIQNSRNDAAAKRRVTKKLSQLGGRKCKILDAAKLKLPAGDALFVTPSCVFVLRCIGWGTCIYGSVKGDPWRAKHNDEERAFPNPLREMKSSLGIVSRRLCAAGLSEIDVQPLVVFADPFQNPSLYLEYGACSVTFADLKKWYKSLPASPFSAEKLKGIVAALQNS